MKVPIRLLASPTERPHWAGLDAICGFCSGTAYDVWTKKATASACRNRLPGGVALRHIRVVARRIRAPIPGISSVPVIASGWMVIVGPTPSATPPPAAEGGNHDKPAVEAMLMKSPIMEFAKMAVMEPMKFAKARMKSAAVECWESGMESATVEC